MDSVYSRQAEFHNPVAENPWQQESTTYFTTYLKRNVSLSYFYGRQYVEEYPGSFPHLSWALRNKCVLKVWNNFFVIVPWFPTIYHTNSVPAATYFSKTHEYVKVDGNSGVIGITNHAQEQLGEVVYVDLVEACPCNCFYHSTPLLTSFLVRFGDQERRHYRSCRVCQSCFRFVFTCIGTSKIVVLVSEQLILTEQPDHGNEH